MVNKKATLRLSHELCIYLRHLYQDQNLSLRSLSRSYSQFSLPTVWRHATRKIEVHPKQTKGKGGRKLKLRKRDGLWSFRTCFYLGAKHFIHKTNSVDQAKAPKHLVWRKKSEGLYFKGK